ncbi:flagellin lysine-N-methylase [Paenibacillus sp. FSL H8-0280]|uniref:flagellin lysine-N-methylase n=1 Tax=Paenibacillus sp. FSL H8-0280 TaxID=2921382 RepID=UPI00324D1F93
MTQTILSAQYMQKFSCIGSACEDSCCSGWRVDIDEKTYQKYRKVKHSKLTPMLKKFVSRNRSNPNSLRYAKLKMDDQKNCSFLNENKLCSIQLELGESYLSKVCSTYPRNINRVDEGLEKSATVSCPEIARLALLNPDGIEFDQIIQSGEAESSRHRVLNTQNENTAPIAEYFWDLRIFTIQILQDRNYELQNRLIFLGMFYKKLDEYMKESRYKEVPHLITSYKIMFNDSSLKNSFDAIPVQQVVQMELIKKIAQQRFVYGIGSKRYLELYDKVIKGLDASGDSLLDEKAAAYDRAFHSYYRPFMSEHEYILENYLVNHVYQNLFPLSGFDEVFDNYVLLVIHYAIIKLHLIGLAGAEEGLSQESIIATIQVFSKVVEHNSLFLTGIFNLLKENGFTSMAYMSVLIKN